MEVRLRRLGPTSKINVLKVPKECRTKIWLAGRGTNCQIYTKSKFASRQHFSITYREKKFFISDLQSANGTFVNDKKLDCEKLLTFGSQISVGVPLEMWESAECVVYVFEPYSENVPATSPVSLPTIEPPPIVKTPTIDPAPRADSNETIDLDSDPEDTTRNPTGAASPDEEKTLLNDSSSSDVIVIESPTEADGPRPAKIRKIERESPVIPMDCESVKVKREVEATTETEVVPKTTTEVVPKTRTEVVPKTRTEVVPKTTTEVVPKTRTEVVPKTRTEVVPKTRTEVVPKAKTEMVPKTTTEVVPKTRTEVKPQEDCAADDDMAAYEALTQVDEPQVKTEPDLMNYSLTEELIELSDSEDDWSTGQSLKVERSDSPEGGDEDDDVVFLETITKKSASSFDAPPVVCKTEDDLTEIDKKWLGKLLKVKHEKGFSGGSEEVAEAAGISGVAEQDRVKAPQSEQTYQESHVKTEEFVAPCAARLSRLSTDDTTDSCPAPSVTTFGAPKKPAKGVTNKSVSFNLVPQIRYFEVPPRPKLSASEKGRSRFTRVIYNICNWNTHWLEECKRVAPDKDPPGICEEQLRKIPKKFPSHSDYMAAFVPVMLLHVWNTVKEKWVKAGESGFRQTVSCDSYADHSTQNLLVYKCTGLVQDADVHKELLRDGHLVLLRLHQTPNPEFVTPASEKYSKKLGYLVFGFVESRVYERFNNQSLHPALAERCASAVGDLHIVRLTILVKKRPSFLLDKRKLIQLTVVHRISQEIRTFRGICLLPESSLCGVLLKPTSVESSLVEPPKMERIVFKGPLDDVQCSIVRKLSFACFSTNSFLYSIHGAAGTGKGQVIAALILQLLYGDDWKNRRPKILYCTQRSVPLDEMVVKLKVCSQTADEPFRLVRVGPMRDMKPEVRDVCLPDLAANLRATDKRARDGRRFDAEVELLRDADVICTTCLSAGIAKMCAAFGKLLTRDRSRKVICIIDEAMSSPEKDSVIPLLLGVTHLILVGDTYQMEPVFAGEKMHSLGLDMPLFWRIYKNFTSLSKELWPIFILKTQYRMNSSLSKFVCPLVYNTMLQKPAVSVSGGIAKLRTHLLLIDRTPENMTAGEREFREAKIVSQLVKAVTNVVKANGRSILGCAVIACDGRQAEALQVLLPKRELPGLEIDQIQALQGREFDVVVFAYDGRKILTSWLATTLTRARCSLFVFASQQSVAGHPMIGKMFSSAEKYSFLKHVGPDTTVEEFEKIVKVQSS